MNDIKLFDDFAPLFWFTLEQLDKSIEEKSFDLRIGFILNI